MLILLPKWSSYFFFNLIFIATFLFSKLLSQSLIYSCLFHWLFFLSPINFEMIGKPKVLSFKLWIHFLLFCFSFWFELDIGILSVVFQRLLFLNLALLSFNSKIIFLSFWHWSMFTCRLFNSRAYICAWSNIFLASFLLFISRSFPFINSIFLFHSILLLNLFNLLFSLSHLNSSFIWSHIWSLFWRKLVLSVILRHIFSFLSKWS